MTDQTALTRPPNAPTTTPQRGLALTGPLRCWLIEETSDRVAVETIRKSAVLSAEARELMPRLREEALRPATAEQIRSIIGQRFALFPQPKRNDGEWTAWWADYLGALKGLTPYAVEAGMAAWVRDPDAEFMCKPGKLAELARTTANGNPWAKAFMRADAATKVPEVEPDRPTGDRPSPEAFKAMLAEVKAALVAKDPLAQARARAARPTPSATVDDTGMSPEMRAKLAEQRQTAR